ncbi:hypothetical protein BDV25DRAFT_154301 [Aspergillus avenaceus]|uniref:Uncharacterized protein n=1 Tax=Aspergillus avenaceus TaxID=36643 RepID=A0A5N6TWN4_ASPAV|nr:hypothetical protein BDV25DRAFT_154301 [Aspergillus avenaceus]
MDSPHSEYKCILRAQLRTESAPTDLVNDVQPEKRIPKSKDIKETHVWFSVFIGEPFLLKPMLDHACFSAAMSAEVLDCLLTNNNYPLKNETERRSASMIYATAPPDPKHAALFRAIVSLSYKFEKEIFSIVGFRCAICKQRAATLLLHRPLCANKDMYKDSKRACDMMSTIASHVNHVKMEEEIEWCIGRCLSDRPFLCSLAVPICSEVAHCFGAAKVMIQKYTSATSQDKDWPCRNIGTNATQATIPGSITNTSNTKETNNETESSLCVPRRTRLLGRASARLSRNDPEKQPAVTEDCERKTPFRSLLNKDFWQMYERVTRARPSSVQGAKSSEDAKSPEGKGQDVKPKPAK